MHQSLKKLSNDELLRIAWTAKPQKPTVITATYSITTPMFLGDANQEATAISASSVKGALRFWWRAWQWKNVLADAGNDETQAIKRLHRLEAELFGSSAYTKESDTGGVLGKGKFSLLVKGNPEKMDQARLDTAYDLNDSNNNWAGYLLGLGLFENKKVPRPNNPNQTIRRNLFIRSAFNAGGSFDVICKCQDEETVKEVRTTLLLWGLLGGLGSRARKGLGSVSIKSLTDTKIPKNDIEIRETLQKLLSDQLTKTEPPFTAFSQQSVIKVSPLSADSTAWRELCKLAKTMQLYRGWGFSSGNDKPHTINGIKARHDAYKTKANDHDWVYDIARQSDKTKTQRRLPDTLPDNFAFGLPRSYGLSQRRYELKFEPKADSGQRSRRASPLFIHLHQFPDGNITTVQSFLPARFLPAQDVVDAQAKGNNGFQSIGTIPAPHTMNWQVIHDYLALDDFKDWETITLRGKSPA